MGDESITVAEEERDRSRDAVVLIEPAPDRVFELECQEVSDTLFDSTIDTVRVFESLAVSVILCERPPLTVSEGVAQHDGLRSLASQDSGLWTVTQA